MGVRKAQAAGTEAALKDAARRLFVERGYLNTKITDITRAAGRSTGSFYEHFDSKEALLEALLGDLRAQASDEIAAQSHPAQPAYPARPPHPADHDLTDHGQLRAHLAAAWHTMRDNLPVVLALHESAVAAGPGSGQPWRQLTADTGMLRAHLEWLRDHGHPLPGEPELVAAAMGGMLATLAYALLPAALPAGPDRYSDDQVIDTVTSLLLGGLRG